VTAAHERFTQCSSSGSVSATSPSVLDERALLIDAAGGFNRGRVFGMGSEAVRAREQLQRGYLSSSDASPSVQNKDDATEELVRRRTAELERKVVEMSGQICVQQRLIAQIWERMGIPPPSTTGADDESETQEDATFIPPPDVTPGVPHRSRSPPPPPSGAAPVGA
jgi:hypothetical protein